MISIYISWCVDATVEDISTAFRVEDEAQIAFWDAFVVATAARSGAARLLSEDLNPGQTVLGVLIENPFLKVN